MIRVLLLVVLLQAIAAAANVADAQVRVGITVRPETVTVGDPFMVTVRVSAPRGSVIAFPAGPDSGSSVEAVDPRAVLPNRDSLTVDESAQYRLVAWDTGSLHSALADVQVTGRARQRVSLANARVYVRSVLPRDTTLHIPKPAREIFASLRPWWYRLLAGLLALALAGLLLWAWWRRRKRKRSGAVEEADAFVHAEREFARVEAMGLLEAGERGRFVALMVDVMRDYLALRVDAAHPALTSSEIIRALENSSDVPSQRLGSILWEADLIKFARRPVTVERARAMARDSRGVVREVEDAVRARSAPDRAAA
ncbi:MAG: hypothetical protein H7Z74_14485 [Anaerolineae bacterium]|nr:hypothetical protein [Gemmatimonadaceae bacterium]